MLFVGTQLGTLVLRLVRHSEHAALNAIVVRAELRLALSVRAVFGREANEPDEGWLRCSVASECSSSGCRSSSATWAEARRRLRDRGRDLDGLGSYQQD